MKPPEEIYIGIVPSDLGNYTYTTVGKDFPNAIEYIRTDAFIEKACDAYCKVCKMPNSRSNECKWLSDFKEYLSIITISQK